MMYRCYAKNGVGRKTKCVSVCHILTKPGTSVQCLHTADVAAVNRLMTCNTRFTHKYQCYDEIL